MTIGDKIGKYVELAGAVGIMGTFAALALTGLVTMGFIFTRKGNHDV